MIGSSPAMVELSRLIERFGPTDLTVLIEGESGTGKELVANALHQSSPRSRRIFAAVNCGELTETIVQSELFGHERGSFTGADRQHAGWFERASGGTLFLDEIGELPMTVQPRLLRVLQERKIHRLGGTQSIDVDVRIIAATNVNLERAIAQDRFRSDLYYRINELSLTTPPLRDRREDIPLLAECFMQRFKEETGLSVDGVSPEASRILQQYSWPGNVRELENAIKRIVVTARNRVVQPADLPPKLLRVSLPPVLAALGPCGDLLWEIEREVYRVILIHFEGNARKAAEFIGREYKSFLKRIKRLKLDQSVFAIG